MIKAIRRKFILFSTLSALGILVITFTIVNVVNFVTVANDADEITSYLVKNHGQFPDRPDFPQIDQSNEKAEITSQLSSFVEKLNIQSADETAIEDQDENTPPLPGSDKPLPEPPGGKETPYDTRFFTITYTKNGQVIANTREISAFTNEQAIALANDYKEKDKGWAQTYYRYRFVTQEDGSRFGVFVDYMRQLKPSYTFLWTSLASTAIGIGLSFLLIFFLSKKVVSPIAENNRKQKRFISDASHELKTPLTIISANTEILEMTLGESEETRTIKKELNKLTDMIRNLNSLAKVQENTEIIFENVDLTGVCKDIASEFITLFENKGIKFTSNIAPNISKKCNEAVLRKILGIVLENSTKYALTEATLSLSKESNRIIIQVENDADLDKEGELDDVFERFYRSRHARASEIEGSGIGLSMAYDLTNLLNGRIKAIGKDGKFLITIQL